jgi:tripartite-type tricarboxylate transporter receptor subunit TctC
MHVVARLMLGWPWLWGRNRASAAAYPSKPIRVIVSIAPASVTDVIMRAAAALQTRLGQPLVIENIGSAAGILGGKTCAQATGDGYTICVIYHSTMSFNPLLFNNLPTTPTPISFRWRGCSSWSRACSPPRRSTSTRSRS